jgi:hypothetical protein
MRNAGSVIKTFLLLPGIVDVVDVTWVRLVVVRVGSLYYDSFSVELHSTEKRGTIICFECLREYHVGLVGNIYRRRVKPSPVRIFLHPHTKTKKFGGSTCC